MSVKLFSIITEKLDFTSGQKEVKKDLKDVLNFGFKKENTSGENISAQEAQNAIDEAAGEQETNKSHGWGALSKRKKELSESFTLLEKYHIAMEKGTLEQDLSQEEIQKCKDMINESYKKQLDSVNDIINSEIEASANQIE